MYFVHSYLCQLLPKPYHHVPFLLVLSLSLFLKSTCVQSVLSSCAWLLAFHCSEDTLPGSTSLKKLTLAIPTAISFHASLLRVGLQPSRPLPNLCWNLDCLTLMPILYRQPQPIRVHECNRNCFVVVCPTSGSHKLPVSPLTVFTEPCDRGVIYMSHLGLSTMWFSSLWPVKNLWTVSAKRSFSHEDGELY